MSVADFVPYAQVGGTLAAAIGLFLNAWQTWRGRRANTLQNLQDFFQSMTEREAAFAHAEDSQKKRHAFVEFLNFLEIYSAAVNGGLFVGVAKGLVRNKIIDSIVALENAEQWHEEIVKSVTSEVTYKHLVRFYAKQRHVIADRRNASLASG